MFGRSLSSPRAWGCFCRYRRRSRLCQSSPRAWGCFRLPCNTFLNILVFPTRVGVFLMSIVSSPPRVGLPHARGGVSIITADDRELPPSSPRAWGCFCKDIDDYLQEIVFPTRVGVFPWANWIMHTPLGLPHARGGVSSRIARRDG